MDYPQRFSDLPEYAFPRLRRLLDAHAPGQEPVSLSLGEPKHAFPGWITEIIAREAAGFGNYPPNDGAPELLAAAADWLKRRFGADIDPETQVMALNGTREGLFGSCIALCPEVKAGKTPAVLLPNPFYQCYAVAALTAGAEPVYLNATAETGFLPDFDAVPDEVLDRTTIVYLCSPSNPQGAVASRDYWANLLALAEKHDFRIFADECYSEIYRDTPPTGALEVARQVGADPERVLVFHSLSKRSSLPGLRSGFVAGGPQAIARIRQLRAYAGAPLPLPLQRAAQALWADEAHVADSRALYQQKYQIADQVFGAVPGYRPPEAGFFLWLPVDDGEATALRAWQQAGVRVLPGAYLARHANGTNPGQNYIRVAMVAPINEMQRALIRLRDCIYE